MNHTKLILLLVGVLFFPVDVHSKNKQPAIGDLLKSLHSEFTQIIQKNGNFIIMRGCCDNPYYMRFRGDEGAWVINVGMSGEESETDIVNVVKRNGSLHFDLKYLNEKFKMVLTPVPGEEGHFMTTGNPRHGGKTQKIFWIDSVHKHKIKEVFEQNCDQGPC